MYKKSIPWSPLFAVSREKISDWIRSELEAHKPPSKIQKGDRTKINQSINQSVRLNSPYDGQKWSQNSPYTFFFGRTKYLDGENGYSIDKENIPLDSRLLFSTGANMLGPGSYHEKKNNILSILYYSTRFLLIDIQHAMGSTPGGINAGNT
jgi:hypothetical protein